MPRSGGQSTAYGVRYESAVVALAIMDLLLGTKEAVKPQAKTTARMPGEERVDVYVDDYVVFEGNQRSYHQAKHAAPSGGNWTARKLISQGILPAFLKQQLISPSDELFLTTGSDSPFLSRASETARIAVDVEEFRTLCPAKTRNDLEFVQSRLGLSPECILELLRRTHLKLAVMDSLEEQLERVLSQCFKEPKVTASLLRDLALEAAAYGRLLRRQDVLTWLADRGVYPKTALSGEDLRECVFKASSSLRQYAANICGIHIERPETSKIVDWICGDDWSKRFGVLSDIRGSGKSVIMRDVLVGLEARGVPALGVTAELLSPASTQASLQELLNLPAPVETIVAHMAVPRMAVIIDQIDALSCSLARDQRTIDLVLDLIARLRQISGVKVIASCRDFDLDTDPKLSTLEPDVRFSIEPLSDTSVGSVLDALDVDRESLLPAQLELLRVPIHLKLFSLVCGRRPGPENIWPFRNLQDLYSEFWRLAIEQHSANSPSPSERIAVVNTLVSQMHQRRQLHVPEGVLDDRIQAATFLQQQGFIRRIAGSWAFLHDTLYDYCYARRFVADRQSIAEYILRSEQGLFVRSEVLQVLSYLRYADPDWYTSELGLIIGSSRTRAHLLKLILGWLGSLRDPAQSEVAVIQTVMDEPAKRRYFLDSAAKNEAWTAFLLDRLVPYLVCRDTESQNEAAWCLRTAIKHSPESVLAFLESHDDSTEYWEQTVNRCMASLESWDAPTALRLFEKVVQRNAHSDSVLFRLKTLAKQKPDAACSVLRNLLDLRVREILACNSPEQGRSISISYDQGESVFDGFDVVGAIEDAAEAAPAEFVRQMVPWFLNYLNLLCPVESGDFYTSDPLFSFRWRHRHFGPEDFMIALSGAVKKVAKEDPSLFQSLSNSLEASEWQAAHRLLVSGFIAWPGHYSDRAHRYLLADRRRLLLGEDSIDSCSLIAAIFPYFDDTQRFRLQETVLDVVPPWERTNPTSRGWACLSLLMSIPEKDLSPQARRRLQELRRKFPSFRRRSFAVEFGPVLPPISQTGIDKMTDTGWLGAIRKYHEGVAWSQRKWPLAGGIEELANALATRAKQEPERFSALAMRFDETVSSKYILAAIRGVAASKNGPDLVFGLVRWFHDRTERDLRKEICYAVKTITEATPNVPEDIRAVIRDYALNDPDPQEETRPKKTSDVRSFHSEDPHTFAINTVRGAAVRAFLACTLDDDRCDVESVFEFLESVSRDKSTGVCSCLVEALPYLLRADPRRCWKLFEAIFSRHAGLLLNKVSHDFLYYAHRDTERLRPYVSVLLGVEDEASQEAGASLACLALFSDAEYKELVERVIAGTPAQRVGAASVFARNLEQPGLLAICERYLLRLMDDPEPKVLHAIGECFDHLRPEHAELLGNFIETFLASSACLENCHGLVGFVKNVSYNHRLVLNIVTRLVERLGRNLNDLQLPYVMVERDLVWLVLSVHTHSPDESQRRQCVDLLDQLLEYGSTEAEQALRDYDRQ